VRRACYCALLDEAVPDKPSEEIGEDGRPEVVPLFLAEAPSMVDRLEPASISSGGSLLREVHTVASAASVRLLCVGQTYPA
jgi:hypothetical protein